MIIALGCISWASANPVSPLFATRTLKPFCVEISWSTLRSVHRFPTISTTLSPGLMLYRSSAMCETVSDSGVKDETTGPVISRVGAGAFYAANVFVIQVAGGRSGRYSVNTLALNGVLQRSFLHRAFAQIRERWSGRGRFHRICDRCLFPFAEKPQR